MESAPYFAPVVRALFWLVIAALVVGAFATHGHGNTPYWLLAAALAVGAIGAYSNVFED